MNDECTILATDALKTRIAGNSLASSLYDVPVTLALQGELGAGKTTFLQGFADALGIREPLTSPTYALEQRYDTPRGPFMHLDLYRLSREQSEELLRSSEDFPGIRCIEWSERVSLDRLVRHHPVISLRLQEDDHGHRTISCVFRDARLPAAGEIRQWRADVRLPGHIADHCDAVAGFAEKITQNLTEQGRIVRPLALRRAAEIHDLFRFLDFRPGGHPTNDHGSDALAAWESVRGTYPNMHHEEACAAFLRQHGFDALAQIVEVHGLSDVPRERRTIEEKILFYADKRVMLDRVVTLEERFEDFANRYGKGRVSDEHRRWYKDTKRVEAELFPDEVPL